MKNILCACVLLSAGLSPLVAQAGTIDLTFEGVGNLASVNNYYNGGTDSQGNSGTNYGISFSSSSLGLVEASHGGSGNITNASSGVTVLYFANSTAVLDDAAGFSDGFSFFYAASRIASITVYSGLDKTGEILARLSLPTNYSSSCGYCRFDPVGVTFSGIAHSVDFGGSANYVAFDDITIGSAAAGTTVPEPESFLLMGLGLVALAAARRKPHG